jgi:hypothetical protein
MTRSPILLHLREKAGAVATLRLQTINAVIASQMLNQLAVVFRPRLVLSQLYNTPQVIAAKKLYCHL